jgi:hypothetical protein
MKKQLNLKKQVTFVLLAVTITAMSSCATVFGGKVSEYQRTKPVEGKPSREIRVGALIADVILFWPGAIVDFATGAIYKPEGK